MNEKNKIISTLNNQQEQQNFIDKNQELEYYKSKYESFFQELSKCQQKIQTLEKSNTKLQETVKNINNNNNNKNNNDSSHDFMTPFEFKKFWEYIIQTELIESFDFCINEYILISNLAQDIILLIYEQCKKEIDNKFIEVLNCLNLGKISKEKRSEIFTGFMPFFRANINNIFIFSEIFLNNIYSKLSSIICDYDFNNDVKMIKETSNLDESGNNSQNDKDIINKSDYFLSKIKKQITQNNFDNLIKNFYKICLYMLLHEPTLFFNIEKYHNRKCQYVYFNKNDYINVDGFGNENSPCIIIISPPLIKNKYPFNGLKGAVYIIPNPDSEINKECEENKNCSNNSLKRNENCRDHNFCNHNSIDSNISNNINSNNIYLPLSNSKNNINNIRINYLSKQQMKNIKLNNGNNNNSKTNHYNSINEINECNSNRKNNANNENNENQVNENIDIKIKTPFKQKYFQGIAKINEINKLELNSQRLNYKCNPDNQLNNNFDKNSCNLNFNKNHNNINSNNSNNLNINNSISNNTNINIRNIKANHNNLIIKKNLNDYSRKLVTNNINNNPNNSNYKIYYTSNDQKKPVKRKISHINESSIPDDREDIINTNININSNINNQSIKNSTTCQTLMNITQNNNNINNNSSNKYQRISCIIQNYLTNINQNSSNNILNINKFQNCLNSNSCFLIDNFESLNTNKNSSINKSISDILLGQKVHYVKLGENYFANKSKAKTKAKTKVNVDKVKFKKVKKKDSKKIKSLDKIIGRKISPFQKYFISSFDSLENRNNTLEINVLTPTGKKKNNLNLKSLGYILNNDSKKNQFQKVKTPSHTTNKQSVFQNGINNINKKNKKQVASLGEKIVIHNSYKNIKKNNNNKKEENNNFINNKKIANKILIKSLSSRKKYLYFVQKTDCIIPSHNNNKTDIFECYKNQNNTIKNESNIKNSNINSTNNNNLNSSFSRNSTASKKNLKSTGRKNNKNDLMIVSESTKNCIKIGNNRTKINYIRNKSQKSTNVINRYTPSHNNNLNNNTEINNYNIDKIIYSKLPNNNNNNNNTFIQKSLQSKIISPSHKVKSNRDDKNNIFYYESNIIENNLDSQKLIKYNNISNINEITHNKRSFAGCNGNDYQKYNKGVHSIKLGSLNSLNGGIIENNKKDNEIYINGNRNISNKNNINNLNNDEIIKISTGLKSLNFCPNSKMPISNISNDTYINTQITNELNTLVQEIGEKNKSTKNKTLNNNYTQISPKKNLKNQELQRIIRHKGFLKNGTEINYEDLNEINDKINGQNISNKNISKKENHHYTKEIKYKIK